MGFLKTPKTCKGVAEHRLTMRDGDVYTVFLRLLNEQFGVLVRLDIGTIQDERPRVHAAERAPSERVGNKRHKLSDPAGFVEVFNISKAETTRELSVHQTDQL